LQLLSDPKSKQLSRESCCLGLAACQGLSDAAQSRGIEGAIENKEQSILLNNRLLKAFGQTTNHGSSAMMETRSQNEQRMRENSNQEAVSASPMTEAFGIEAGETGGAAGVGEAALGAFKEMAAAAHVLGRPDVLYSLMLLSVTHVTWSTAGFRDRYNSSSLLGTGSETSARNQKEIREALKPHMSKLIPRLLRACNDPGKQTREQINALWIGLTGGGADARDLISHHFTQTIDTLLDDATNKLWRARVGACGALADVIVGRSWEDLGGGGLILEDDINSIKDTAASRLLRLYRVSVRSLDDVRLTVRESGEALARSVRSLTVRLCDPNISMEILKGYGTLSTKKRMKLEKSIRMTSTAAAGTVLPWLMKYGLNQPCAEATGFAVSCLLGIVEISKSETLTPVLPELIGHLLLAMSGLEPAALNYFQNRAAGQQSDTSGYDQLERVRLQLAQSGPIASALNKCLEMMKHAPLVSQRKLIPELDSSLRRGAGFATRAATADAVSSLCSVCPLAFKFTGNSTSNPTVRLLRALYYASERERGIGAQDKMTHAFGNLAALAPGSSVRSIAMRLCERYKHAMGSNDDPATRKSAVSALRAIAVRASNQFADGGSKNVWERVVLPLSFIGQRDDKIGPIWKEVWEEGGQVAALSLTNESMRNCQLQETLLPDLVISLIEALDDVSWQRRVMACSTISELSDTKILSPPAKATGRKVSLTDTSSILRAKHRADASQKLLCACIQLIDKSKRVWNGKGDLIKTIANISSNWASYTYMEESNSSHIYGWKKEDIEKCSWVPILHVPNSWEHLHPNDNWFQIKKQTDTSMQEDLDSLQLGDENQDTDVNNDSENNTLSFEECDRILEDESDHKMLSEPDQNKSNIPQPVTYSGLCRLIFEQSVPFEGKSVKSFFSTEVLPYRTAALQSLAMLLKSANQGSCSQSGTSTAHTKFLFKKIVPPILSIVDVKGDFISKEQKEQFKAISVPPVIVARCFDCVSAVMWGNMDSTCTDLTDFTKLFLHNCGGNQAAWTVKESAALAAANLSSNANLRHLRKIHVTENLLECCIACLKDRKFSKVRIAGLKILLAMSKRPRLSRDGLKCTDENDDALILDALLPYKERMLEISKLALRDSESKVTAIASDICSTLSCWP
jgi:proteasome component ECM29